MDSTSGFPGIPGVQVYGTGIENTQTGVLNEFVIAFEDDNFARTSVVGVNLIPPEGVSVETVICELIPGLGYKAFYTLTHAGSYRILIDVNGQLLRPIRIQVTEHSDFTSAVVAANKKMTDYMKHLIQDVNDYKRREAEVQAHSDRIVAVNSQLRHATASLSAAIRALGTVTRNVTEAIAVLNRVCPLPLLRNLAGSDEPAASRVVPEEATGRISPPCDVSFFSGMSMDVQSGSEGGVPSHQETASVRSAGTLDTATTWSTNISPRVPTRQPRQEADTRGMSSEAIAGPSRDGHDQDRGSRRTEGTPGITGNESQSSTIRTPVRPRSLDTRSNKRKHIDDSSEEETPFPASPPASVSSAVPLSPALSPSLNIYALVRAATRDISSIRGPIQQPAEEDREETPFLASPPASVSSAVPLSPVSSPSLNIYALVRAAARG